MSTLRERATEALIQLEREEAIARQEESRRLRKKAQERAQEIYELGLGLGIIQPDDLCFLDDNTGHVVVDGIELVQSWNVGLQCVYECPGCKQRVWSSKLSSVTDVGRFLREVSKHTCPPAVMGTPADPRSEHLLDRLLREASELLTAGDYDGAIARSSLVLAHLAYTREA